MNTKELKTRDQIDSKYKWNIEAMTPMNPLSAGNWKPSKKKPRPIGEELCRTPDGKCRHSAGCFPEKRRHMAQT